MNTNVNSFGLLANNSFAGAFTTSKRLLINGLMLLFLVFGASLSLHAQVKIEVQNLKKGKNLVSTPQGEKLQVTYNGSMITAVGQILPNGSMLMLKGKPAQTDRYACWEDHKRKMSICIKCTCPKN